MMIQEKRPQSTINTDRHPCKREAVCLYALITDKRSVSRRNRASWYLRQLNKVVKCDQIESFEENDLSVEKLSINDTDKEIIRQVESNDTDINLVSVTTSLNNPTEINNELDSNIDNQQFLVTPNTRVLYISKSIASSIILDLSPSVVSVSPQNDCIFLDSMFDALKRVLHLLVKTHEIPYSQGNTRPFVLGPKVFVSVIAYTPFVVAKNNQVLVQNRRISSANIDQVSVELWICLNRLTQEIHELVSNNCGMNLEFDTTKTNKNVFVFPQPISGGVIRHPGAVLEDIYELGLFSSSLMPRLSRLSMITISDGLFASTNNLNIFRLKSIAVSFVSLGAEAAYPDACFGYTPYIDLMKFVAKTTLGVYLSHQDLINSSHSLSKSQQVPLLNNPLYKLFCWTIHSAIGEDQFYNTPKETNFHYFNPAIDPMELTPEHVAKFFCVDQPMNALQPSMGDKGLNCNASSSRNYHDWRSFKQLERDLDADFEQVLSCLLREGYLIKSIQFKHKETSKIVARLVLHWRHNLDLEQELTAPYWNNTDPFDMGDNNQLILRPFNTPLYGDTYCEIMVHGSYSFLHNIYCNRRSKRRSEYREIAYQQFRQLIDGVLQTHDRLQYLSQFYRDSSLSKVPSFLLHGNSLLYEQPHTHRLTSTIENVLDETKTCEFQEYWQKISCLDTNSWKNLMHIHTLRLVLEHDQPKHKNIHYQNANGRYTHVQCRRALSAISTFIKSYASFALLEDTTYIKFIYNKDDDLREIETSATKGFIVIRINKLLPIIVIYLMFTSGILDSHRVQIVSYLENQLINCKLRNIRTSSSIQMDNILTSKTISPSSESCCVLIRSPLERMLKVYSRNFINDFLIHNWAHGLPGSCPYNLQQSLKVIPSSNDSISGQQQQPKPRLDTTTNTTTSTSDIATKENVDEFTPDDSSFNRYNLIFGKYLYGVRIIHTITNLPHDIIPSLAANVLSKISAILVNVRIKQGFHIAFNNSGILNLVVELSMKDHSNGDHDSSCLCQYIVFPPTVTSCPQTMHTVLNTNNNNNSSSNNNSNNNNGASSKPGSLSGSLVNSDSYMRQTTQDSHPHMRGDNGEIKMIKEYWIEQQYGISSHSGDYHHSLQNMRYSEIVDHLFITDSSIFECLLTYDLLQLLCDKLSLYYDLDSSFVRIESKTTPIFSPTTSTTSSNVIEHDFTLGPNLPSTLIEGNTKNGNSKVPFFESEYKFSVVKFLDYCQQASLNVLLFRDHSEFYKSGALEEQSCKKNPSIVEQQHSYQVSGASKNQNYRKMSVDVNDFEGDHVKREHRSSYQHDNLNANTYTYVSPIYSPSLNHMFLETLHKRLKQMHDKEIELSDYDRKKLPMYLKLRQQQLGDEHKQCSLTKNVMHHKCYTNNRISSRLTQVENNSYSDELSYKHQDSCCVSEEESIEWRCFLRKGNQENLMIVLMPATLLDVNKWLNFVNIDNSEIIPSSFSPINALESRIRKYDPVCPIFVFRCSTTMINDHVLSFLKYDDEPSLLKSCLEYDLSLHFGQPCNYMGQLKTLNDELNTELLSLIRFGALNQTTSDEKTLEAVHFGTFLRKIKNTVLKSRFSSLNDAYLSELFIHRDDILYYINNVDMDTQKKYHVSSQLKSLADFIKNYEEYSDSLPKELGKPCNKILNSILLQKCGLFINQPIARFNESNPLIKQLHDKKLLFLMRCNYKIELPILEENLADSMLLKGFVKSNQSNIKDNPNIFAINHSSAVSTLSSSINETSNVTTSSLGKSDGTRLMEMKCGSVGACSPSANFGDRTTSKIPPAARFGSNSTINSMSYPTNDSFILEAFRGSKSCSIKELPKSILDDNDDISLRHEAHMAEVLRRTGERKESHHYRKVLKSKGNYNQSHSAIDQALKRVDSLGRLEHFCLTPILFSPSWRSKLAPVRDHTIQSNISYDNDNHYKGDSTSRTLESKTIDEGTKSESLSISCGANQQMQTTQQEATNDRWHQMVCNNYIKEYEQYIQTLGFNSVQIRYQSNAKGSTPLQSSSATTATTIATKTTSVSKSNITTSLRLPNTSNNQHVINPSSLYSSTKQSGHSIELRRGSISTSTASLLASASASTYNTGYLIKFLNSGCLVFKVGFCKPYVFSILYSIEGERFNNSNMKINMTAFLDELDNIKVNMHLHSFTYDYHLRSMYSYISGRQLTFSPGYHLISFLDDFRKYYQKAPNYTRNHILSGEVSVTNIKVTGQQLYNYIVTHNSIYNMEVLEMSSSISNVMPNLSSRTFMISGDQNQETSNSKDSVHQETNSSRGHANDYVLIELKREKIRYRDGKDPDIFDCGLLITHDVQHTNSSKNCLTLKYFLLLTNQRDLYPRLIHAYDSIISLGCHRPIRLGITQQLKARQSAHKSSNTTGPSSGQSDPEDIQSSELQSSGETTSGPQSIVSTTNSIQSSNSELQFGSSVIDLNQQSDTCVLKSSLHIASKNKIDKSEEATDTLKKSLENCLKQDNSNLIRLPVSTNEPVSNQLISSGDASPNLERKRKNSTNSNKNDNGTINIQERTICDEEITYLGYFSSDEMDMLKFLQEKTANLRVHIEQVVRLAEVHYRRDYLWHKLMQRTSTVNTKSDEIPLTPDELIQLLTIVEAIDLATLDPQLSSFTTLHINWYIKLIKAFNDLKQSSMNQHRIYSVKTSKLLLLYIDPKCTTAFILLAIDSERSTVELNMLLKDKQEFSSKIYEKTPTKSTSEQPSTTTNSSNTRIELDQDCQQLINDFINFCATFMWFTFLT